MIKSSISANSRLFSFLQPADLITIIYIVITATFQIIFARFLPDVAGHLIIRLGILIFILVLIELESRHKSNIIYLIHLFYPLLLLAYFFQETAYMNHLFVHHYLDSWFIGLEEKLFGYLPSVAFSKNFSMHWFSELLNFGYFSYYFIVFGGAILFYIKYPAETEKVIFIIMASFFLYYLIFIFLPTEGPIYYLKPPFNSRIHSGIFSQLVNLADKAGDGPTGAFPSSHVGIAWLMVLLTFKKFKIWFWIFLILAILICFATVYIKAHYFFDVIGGLITAPVFLWFSKLLFPYFSFSQNMQK